MATLARNSGNSEDLKIVTVFIPVPIHWLIALPFV